VPEPETTLLFGWGFEREGRTTQQNLGLSFLTICAIATILDKPA
jgi:hypothetical protein